METSLSPLDLARLSGDVIATGLDSLEWLRFPIDGQSKGEVINRIWYLTFDLDVTREQMRQFIYEDRKPASS